MRKPLAEHVSDRVRATLAVKRVSGAELARRMEVSPTYVWRRVNGEVPFDVADLERIADLIGVPVGELLTDLAATP